MARKISRSKIKAEKTKPPVEIVLDVVEKEEFEEEKKLFEAIDRPTAPLLRLIREGDSGPYCPICGSSLKLRWHRLSRTNKCIQPKCDNYHGCCGSC